MCLHTSFCFGVRSVLSKKMQIRIVKNRNSSNLFMNFTHEMINDNG